MQTTIGATSALETLYGSAPRPSVGDAGTAGAAQDAASAVDNTRLVIEQDIATGTFVYKSLDRSTGEVIRQFPREDVLKLKAQGGYEAGAVIKTEA